MPYKPWKQTLSICDFHPCSTDAVHHELSTFSSANDAIDVTLFHWGLFCTGPLSLFETGLGYHVTTESHTFGNYPKQELSLCFRNNGI